jgi:hypothetical protein
MGTRMWRTKMRKRHKRKNDYTFITVGIHKKDWEYLQLLANEAAMDVSSYSEEILEERLVQERVKVPKCILRRDTERRHSTVGITHKVNIKEK